MPSWRAGSRRWTCVKQLELSPRYAWRVVLSNGMLLDLGRDRAPTRRIRTAGRALPFAARIQRFVQAWPAVAGRLEGRTITQADLRYPNGFALALAPLPPSETKSKSIPKPPKKR